MGRYQWVTRVCRNGSDVYRITSEEALVVGRTRAVTATALLLCVVAVPVAADTDAGRKERPRCHDPLPEELTPPTVAVELEVSATTVAAGEPLRLKLTIRNDGPLPIPYTHGGQTHDLWIRHRHGLVWLWSQQAGAFTDIFVRDYLMPGQTRVARARWTRMCPPDGKGAQPGLPGPGRYVARALWVSDVDDSDGDGHGSWWSNEVPFRIRPAK